jgi:hypothetical protein
MVPSMTRETTVLELQSKRPLFATVRLNKATGQNEYVNPLIASAPLMNVTTVSTGRWTDNDAISDDGIACLELHFWRPREERSSTDAHPDFTVDVAVPLWWTEPMYLLAMDRSIQKTKAISIFPATTLRPGYNTVNFVHFLYDIMPNNDDVECNDMMSGLPRRRVEGTVDAT